MYELDIKPLSKVEFGCQVNVSNHNLTNLVESFEHSPDSLLSMFYQADGLLVIKGVHDIASDPGLLVRISRLFGNEVENYRTTITTDQFFHETEDEILVLSNRPPCNFEPPAQPNPGFTADGDLPIQFPHRKGWHTDQSYRRPPPDISLLLGIKCPPKTQGQTLYADGISAYTALSTNLKQRIAKLEGLHALRWTGRTASEVRDSAKVKSLLPHQQPQPQPVVRTHPITGKQALYLCDESQMDFISGPFLQLQSGLNSEGAQLLDELIQHLTRPEFVYVHQWDEGDLVIHDNRSMPHTATWYDSAKYERLMWRTTVMGNPGNDYAGESKSWIAAAGAKPMQGLEDIKF
jgi:taurine dioxygenase